MSISTIILYIVLVTTGYGLVTYLFIQENYFMAVVLYLIGVSWLCIVLSEGLGVLLDWLIAYYYEYSQPEVIIQEVVVVNPEEELGKVPTDYEGETTTTPEIITEVEEEMKEGPVLPLGFTSLWLLSMFISWLTRS